MCEELIVLGLACAALSLAALGMAAWHTWKFEHRRAATKSDKA